MNRRKILEKSAKLYVFRVANSSTTTTTTTIIKRTTDHDYRNGQRIYPTPFFQNQSSMNRNNNDDDREEIVSKRLSFQLLATHRLSTLRHGWIKLNLTQSIRDWFEMAQQQQQQQQNGDKSIHHNDDQSNKLTLLIDCAECNDLLGIDLGNMTMASSSGHSSTKQSTNSKSIISTFSNHHFHNHRQNDGNYTTKISSSSGMKKRKHHRHFRPFLVLETETRSRRRSRRHAYNCEDGVRQCCKQSLYVNFEELGWNDWIIYPRGYHANYCMGECIQQLRSPDMLAYFHSHVLEEYRIKNPYASITPCCAPTKLSSISLIYFDQNHHIIKADLPKMVVNECGCT
ncbi:Transforming growth factor beta like domain containing protein [Euroglyphus maynei]|uniref:Transforming growth factor beta like domain containing protein n=1 Tax=Euroglyphus maynei TaxID=6958 RepID=A0A1Y3ARM4_EURMA|nr:Transforming growth factor beta like domain containing protein [Euroglyphus maynei]